MYNVVVFVFIPAVRPSQGSGEEKEVGNKGGKERQRAVGTSIEDNEFRFVQQ